jgi:hypothetical protein
VQPVASISFTTSTTSSTVAPISTPASVSNAVISTNPSSILSNLVSQTKDAENSATKTIPASTSISTSTVTPSISSLTSTESNIPKPNLGGFSFGFTATTTQSDIPKSTPSIISTISSSSSAPNTSTVTSPIGIQAKPLSPLALFSNPKSDSTADPNKSLISFTPIKPTETVQPSISLQTSSTITSSAPTLPVFGSAASGGFKFGESTAAPKSDNKPSTGFSFGNSPAQTEKVEPKISGGFNFGTSSTTTQNSATNSTPSFSFGGNQALPKLPTAASPLMPSTTSQTSVLNFQNPATTTSASSGMFSFGGNPTAPSSFPAPQSSAPTFGQPAAQTTVASFGE